MCYYWLTYNFQYTNFSAIFLYVTLNQVVCKTRTCVSAKKGSSICSQHIVGEGSSDIAARKEVFYSITGDSLVTIFHLLYPCHFLALRKWSSRNPVWGHDTTKLTCRTSSYLKDMKKCLTKRLKINIIFVHKFSKCLPISLVS